MSLETKFMFLSPVEAVKVAEDNLEEVAAWCGGRVAETESKRKPGTFEKYVWVPVPEQNRISWAFPGMIVTKRVVNTLQGDLAVTFAIFREDYYTKNYFDDPMAAVAGTWERKNANIIRPKGSPERPRKPKSKKKAVEVIQKADRVTVTTFMDQETVNQTVAAANARIDAVLQKHNVS